MAAPALALAVGVGLALVREVRGGGERDGRKEGGHAAEEDGWIAACRLQHIVDARAEDDAQAALQRKHDAERHAEEERALHREISRHQQAAAAASERDRRPACLQQRLFRRERQHGRDN